MVKNSRTMSTKLKKLNKRNSLLGTLCALLFAGLQSQGVEARYETRISTSSSLVSFEIWFHQMAIFPHADLILVNIRTRNSILNVCLFFLGEMLYTKYIMLNVRIANPETNFPSIQNTIPAQCQLHVHESTPTWKLELGARFRSKFAWEEWQRKKRRTWHWGKLGLLLAFRSHSRKGLPC